MGGVASRPVLNIPTSLGEARAIQEVVAREAEAAPRIPLDRVHSVGGADASYSPDGMTIHGAAVVLALPSLEILDRGTSSCGVRFPYRPGYFAFREGPALLGAVAALARKPDLLLVDGHGLAHPRRAGIAVHLGLLLGIPSVGVAKRPLAGDAAIPGPAPGSAVPVIDRGEVIGVALRTRAGSRPVYVSPGYATDLDTAMAVVLSATAGFRIPAPLREAHRVSRELRARGLPRPT
ncbi:MAG TPA: endonuclease V [Methanomicrobiales archaeon]|jgi:deoxyribonuclease V|nr:endonuclease V [Methanomicrobiales archaeon]